MQEEFDTLADNLKVLKSTKRNIIRSNIEQKLLVEEQQLLEKSLKMELPLVLQQVGNVKQDRILSWPKDSRLQRREKII